MTTYRNGLTHGSGLFMDSKYPNEHHVHGYSYLGPGSRLDIRLDDNYKPRVNEQLDSVALSHDIAYDKIKKEYLKDESKQKVIKAVHNADEVFIDNASNSNIQTLGKISAGIIEAKELAEKAGVLNTSTFSGLGNKNVSFKTKSGREINFTKKHDPTARIK